MTQRLRRRRRAPPAWRYSLPSTVTSSAAARRPIVSALPSAISVSGDDNQPASGVLRCRPLCRYIGTGTRNVSESGPRFRPTCLRYSYWLTLDDRRYDFSGCDDHFRPRSCEINNDVREPSARTGEICDDDDESVLRRHLTCCQVTRSRASEQIIRPSSSHCRDTTHSANDRCRTVRLIPDDDHEGRSDARPSSGSDVIADGAVEGRRRLSLSKIIDSGLGTSIHSEQTSPDDSTAGLIIDQHHQQQQLRHRLDDDVTDDVTEQARRHPDTDDDDDVDDWTKLTRHKREYNG